jgi:hypothetical protein
MAKAPAPEDVTITAITTTGCKVDSVLISKTYFMPAPDAKEAKKSPKIMTIALDRMLAREEGTWDNVEGGSYGIGISKVHR